MARRLLFVLALLLVWPSVARAETPDEYRSALAAIVEAADSAVQALPAGASLNDYAQLTSAVQRLQAIHTVTTGDGARVTVDNSILLRRLQGSRADGQRAIESLRQLLAALDASSEKTQWVSKDDARAALDSVLASPALGASSSKSIGQIMQDLRERLFRWLENIFPWFKIPQLPDIDVSKPASIVFWLGAAALITFAAVFLGFAWYHARRNLARSAALKEGQLFAHDDARSARLAAQQAAAAGDYRVAVHHLLLWALLHLAERARLRYDRSLTNREQMRVLAGDGEVRDLLRIIVDAFDRIWYGHAPCTATEYNQFHAAIERIVEVAT